MVDFRPSPLCGDGSHRAYAMTQRPAMAFSRVLSRDNAQAQANTASASLCVSGGFLRVGYMRQPMIL